MAKGRGFKVKSWPLPNGVKRPNENTNTTPGLQVKMALPAQGPGQGQGSSGKGGQKDAHPA